MFAHYSLDTLLGHSLIAIGRAADLVWWIFDVDGAEYSLHTQCTFRVLHDGEAMLSRDEIYCTRDNKPLGKGNSWFDYDVAELAPLLPAKVVSIECSEMNDLTICTENGLCIEIWAAEPPEDEQWRFFRHIPRSDDPHLVAYGNYLDCE